MKVPVDAYGRIVPGWLSVPFLGRRDMLRWVDEIARLKREIARIAFEPYAEELEISKIQDCLEAARTLVIRATPFTPCKLCTAKDAYCEHCKGRFWTTVDGEPRLRSLRDDINRDFSPDTVGGTPARKATHSRGRGKGGWADLYRDCERREGKNAKQDPQGVEDKSNGESEGAEMEGGEHVDAEARCAGV